MGGFWSKLFKGPDGQPPGPGGDYPDAAETYRKLREQVLGLDAWSVAGASDHGGLAAVVMETGYPEAVVTLSVVADGTVSLYFSHGGGILGLGGHEGPREAGARLLAAALPARVACAPASGFPLPRDGHTNFYLVTADGVLTGGGTEDDLVMGRHALSPLHRAAQILLTECRRVDEARSKPPPAEP